MPPSTPPGVAEITAPNLGENPKRMATVAATTYAAVEYTRVAAITPMFSAYVVVGDPPTDDATTVPRPSAAMARPMYGSRLAPVISATALTWPVFSAMRAMTAGMTSSTNAHRNSGRWMPTTLAA